MKYLKKFNEDISSLSDFSKYHTISDEDISDLCLEMTDIGFVLTITRYFMQNGKRTDEPVTNESYPVYDIVLNNGGDTEDKEGYRYDGSYYYQDIDILTGFKSIVNKMKNLSLEAFGWTKEKIYA